MLRRKRLRPTQKYIPKNILVIRTDRIGDVILSTPVLTALKKAFPQAKVTLMVRPDTADLVTGHPDLDELILDTTRENCKGSSGFWKQLRYLRAKRFDAALVLHPTLRLAVLVFLARISIRVGTGYRFYSFLFNRKVFHHRKSGRRHELEYNLELAEKLGAFLEKVEFKFSIPAPAQARVEKLLKSWGIESKDRLVVLHPGSGGSARNWPLARFAELNERLVSELNVKTIMTGGPGEEDLVDTVIRHSHSEPLQCVGNLNLKELAALLQRADLLITNSTGPLHLAVAMGTKVIGFYCPIIPCLPNRWGPYGRPDSVLMPPLSPCKKCLNQNCAYYDCMDLITVEEALALVRKKLFGE